MPGRSGLYWRRSSAAADTKYEIATLPWIGSSASSIFVLFHAGGSEYQDLRRPQERQRQIIIWRAQARPLAIRSCPRCLPVRESCRSRSCAAIRASSMRPGVERGERMRCLPAREHFARTCWPRVGVPVPRSSTWSQLPILDRYISTRRRRPLLELFERAAAARARRDRAAGAARRSSPHPAAVLT